jgi:hypothetical protein
MFLLVAKWWRHAETRRWRHFKVECTPERALLGCVLPVEIVTDNFFLPLPAILLANSSSKSLVNWKCCIIQLASHVRWNIKANDFRILNYCYEDMHHQIVIKVVQGYCVFPIFSCVCSWYIDVYITTFTTSLWDQCSMYEVCIIDCVPKRKGFWGDCILS